MFNDLPEDHFEAFLSVPILCRGKLVGVINVQHRKPHDHTQRQVRLISMIGFLVGAEIEMARLEMRTGAACRSAGDAKDRWIARRAFCSAICRLMKKARTLALAASRAGRSGRPSARLRRPLFSRKRFGGRGSKAAEPSATRDGMGTAVPPHSFVPFSSTQRSGPNEQRKSVVPHLRRSTTWLAYPALPGWAHVWRTALWAWIANTAFSCSFLA